MMREPNTVPIPAPEMSNSSFSTLYLAVFLVIWELYGTTQVLEPRDINNNKTNYILELLLLTTNDETEYLTWRLW